MVQTEPQILADRKTPQHEAESDGVTPDKLMSGAKSKALWIRQRAGLKEKSETVDKDKVGLTVFGQR